MTAATTLDAFRNAWSALAPLVAERERPIRAANLEAFLRRGFPTTREEEWRYTDLGALSGPAYALAPQHGGEPLAELEAAFLPDVDRLVFVNGHFQAALSTRLVDGLDVHSRSRSPIEPFEEEPVSHLNAALAVDGVHLRLAPKRAHPRPIHILNLSLPGAEPSMTHLAHRIVLEGGAEADIIVHNLGRNGGAHFMTQAVQIRVLPNACLRLTRVQDEGDGVQALSRWDVMLERDAQVEFLNFDLGGGLIRNDLNLWLGEPGVQAGLHGLFLPSGRSHVDNHARIDHRFAHGTSRQVFRGIVMDRATAVFNGKVVVHPNAQKTDSDQQLATLLLSKTAQVNAKPELEIHADDVKCAHGASVGQLDETAIFYLRSRGIPPEAARNLLLYTFAREILGRIGNEALRRATERRVLQRLPGGLDLEVQA